MSVPHNFEAYVANTDFDWFTRLRAAAPPEEVNFWLPGSTRPRASLGTPWLFKLKTPYNAIGGGGFFTYYTRMPAQVAWDTFGTMNGVASLSELTRRLQRYSRSPVTDKSEIGCVVLSQPFFLRDEEWINVPSDWSRNIVSGKYYDLAQGEGAKMWARISERAAYATQRVGFMSPAFGTPRLILPRLGQGAFRLMVTDAYERRCAISGERTLPVLDAAHIKAFSLVNQHDVRNGILLRSDIHRLFDAGYVTVTSDLRFQVSRALKDDYANGRIYYDLHNRQIHEPAAPEHRPDREALDYHSSEVFRK